jgi:hypothetical protein
MTSPWSFGAKLAEKAIVPTEPPPAATAAAASAAHAIAIPATLLTRPIIHPVCEVSVNSL